MANLVATVSAATSGTVTMPDTKQDCIVFHDAGVTASLTIAFPANPIDCQRVCISSVAGITTLTLTTAVGSIINALTTIAAGTPSAYMYSASQTKWYKVT